MDTGRGRTRWVVPVVGLLAVAWVAALVVLQQVGYLIEVDRANIGRSQEYAALQQRYHLALAFLGVLVVGPALTSGVAWLGRLRWAAVVAGLLTIVLLPVAYAGGRQADRDWNPPPPPPPGACAAHSGGGRNTCPGG